MQRFESTATWAYNSATVRQANNSTVNQLNFFVGVVEDAVAVSLTTLAVCNPASAVINGIGLNSISTYQLGSQIYSNSQVANAATGGTATFPVLPQLGLNYAAWLESGAASGSTFYGTPWGGINGAIFC
jgi:hypothetical protein